ncbi:MAG: PilZ domain-containing protein [Fuerstiella sp.]|jgi:hypothetical protein
MKQPSSKNERAHYRLPYPQAEGPTVRIEDRDYELSELSEGGAKILLGGVGAVHGDQTFAGVLRFRDGETVSIEGVVVRSDEKEMIVRFSSGISMKRMVAEQIRLQQKYPMMFGTRKDVGDIEKA